LSFERAGDAEIAASVTDPDMTTVNFPEWHFRTAGNRRRQADGNQFSARKKPAGN
jgi:hypothetical protein